MDFLTPDIIGTVATLILGVAGTFLGTKYSALRKALKTIMDAAEDDKITADEVQQIALAVKPLFGKK